MKAVIKIVAASKEFTPDQLAILRRVMMVLSEHKMLVALEKKSKVTKKTSLHLKKA